MIVNQLSVLLPAHYPHIPFFVILLIFDRYYINIFWYIFCYIVLLRAFPTVYMSKVY